MERVALNLQPSEQAVLAAAARIFAAYVGGGRVVEGNEMEWMEKAVREAVWMATAVDAAIIADNEVGK